MDITRIHEFIAINEQVHKVIDRVMASKEIPEYDKWRFIYDYVSLSIVQGKSMRYTVLIGVTRIWTIAMM